MPKLSKKALTENVVKSLKPAQKKYKFSDSGMRGLSVLVQPSGHKTYTVFYRINGKATDYKIGGCHEISLKQAREKAAEILVAARSGVSAAKQRMRARSSTLGGFLDSRYSDYLSKNHSTKTAIWTLRSCFSDFLHLELDEISIDELEKWRQKQQLKPATINRRVATLKAALSKASLWGLIETNPLENVKQLKVPKTPVRFLNDDQLDMVFESLKQRDSRRRRERESHNLWLAQRGKGTKPDFTELELDFDDAPTDYLTPLVRLIADTGLRLNEALSVRWTDISEDRVLTAYSHKTKSFRYIPLTWEAWSQLRYLQRINQASFSEPTDSLFLSEYGVPLKSVKTSWNHIRRKLPFDCDFRMLRRTFGSRLMRNGRSVYEVSQLLGHSNVETTQRWYLSLSLEAASAAIKTIDPVDF